MNRLPALAVVVRPNRAVRMLAVLACVACVAASAGCTLLLPTEQLIVPCQSQADCDDKAGDGFVCEDNACLPEDDGSTSG